MPESRITHTRPAGPDHAVSCVVGGDGTYMTSPCPTCPWRVDATGEFPPEAFIISAHTAYDAAQELFGCHTAGAERPRTCAGFLLRGATHNFAARIRQISNGPFRVVDGGHELHANYRAMAEANGVPSDHPALARIREDV